MGEQEDMNTGRTAYVVKFSGIVRVTVERETKKSYILKTREHRRNDAEAVGVFGSSFYYITRIYPKAYPIFFTLKEATEWCIEQEDAEIKELSRCIEQHQKRKTELAQLL